jgi:hypothetical protein
MAWGRPEVATPVRVLTDVDRNAKRKGGLVSLSRADRVTLWAVAAFGLLGPNGVFLYYAWFRRADLIAALSHPVTLAFVVEAFVVMGLVAVALARAGGRLGWKGFVALSLLGGLGFSLPVLALMSARPGTEPGS